MRLLTKRVTGCHNHYYENVDGEECCIDEKIPFAIPDSWAWIRLGELTNYGTNESIQTKDILADSIIIELEDIEKDSGKIVSYSKKSTNNESIRHIFHRGCVLYSKLRPYLNKVAIPTFDGYCSTEIMVLYPNYEVNLEYLQLVLRSPYFVDYSMSNVYGAKMPRMGTQDGKNALIPLAPLNEQCRIVEFIHRFDFLIEEYRTLSAALISLNNNVKPALSQSIIQSAIQGKLVPQDPNDEPVKIDCKHPIVRRDNSYYEVTKGIEKRIEFDGFYDNLPEKWTIARLSDVVSLLSGRDLEPKQYNDSGRGIVYITGASNIDGDHIIVNRWTDQPSTIAHRGDLLLTCKGTVGATCILDLESAHIARQIMALHSNCMFLPYLRIFIDASINKLQAKKHGTIPGITREDVLNLYVPVPPVLEQKRIADKVKKLLSVTSQLSC